jgi:cytidylate kinase
MPIITIFPGASTRGAALATSVSAALGYRCVGREELLEATKRYGITEAKLTEILDKEPHWWERWLESLAPYRIALQAAMCELAQGGNFVYHGHLGHELLPGIRHLLKVLLTAPMEFRVELARGQMADEAAARRYIDQLDKARTRRLMAMFGNDWRDPNQFDLVLNMAQMSTGDAARLIVEAARLERYQATPASEQELQDLTVSTGVQRALVTSPGLRNSVFEVHADQGRVSLSGILPRGVTEEEVIELAKQVPGVTDVVTNFIRIPIAQR